MQSQQNTSTTPPKPATGALAFIREMSETLKGFSQGCSRNEAFSPYFIEDSHSDMAEALKQKTK